MRIPELKNFQLNAEISNSMKGSLNWAIKSFTLYVEFFDKDFNVHFFKMCEAEITDSCTERI